MSWVRLDDKMHANAKVGVAGNAAIGLRDVLLTWNADTGSMGFVPAHIALRYALDPYDFDTAEKAKKLVQRCVTHGLLDVAEGGFVLHDWHQYALVSDATRREASERQSTLTPEQRKQRSEAGKRSAARAAGRRGSGNGESTETNVAVNGDSTEPSTELATEVNGASTEIQRSEATESQRRPTEPSTEANGAVNETPSTKTNETNGPLQRTHARGIPIPIPIPIQEDLSYTPPPQIQAGRATEAQRSGGSGGNGANGETNGAQRTETPKALAPFRAALSKHLPVAAASAVVVGVRPHFETGGWSVAWLVEQAPHAAGAAAAKGIEPHKLPAFVLGYLKREWTNRRNGSRPQSAGGGTGTRPQQPPAYVDRFEDPAYRAKLLRERIEEAILEDQPFDPVTGAKIWKPTPEDTKRLEQAKAERPDLVARQPKPMWELERRKAGIAGIAAPVPPPPATAAANEAAP